MEGRMELSAFERSRLLSSLACGSFGPLGPISYSGSDSSLGQLVPVSTSEPARATSPSTLQQYADRFLSHSGLHHSGDNYPMMAGYLANNSSHVSESLKHIIPEMHQYWSATTAHSEGYARYLLDSMYYYPYLPYLPATESLALFAQNSASVAHMEAALQAHTAQHRIYELQKDTYLGTGSYPTGLYSSNHFYGSGMQHEATNLSLPSSSKSKQSDKVKDTNAKENKSKRELDLLIESEDRIEQNNSRQIDNELRYHEGSERTRGRSSKTDDRDKIKSSTKTIRSLVNDFTKHRHESSHVPQSTVKETNLLQVGKPLACEVYDYSPRRSTLLSPTRHEQVPSLKAHGTKTISPDRTKVNLGLNKTKHYNKEVEQDMPENLCLKDRKNDSSTCRKMTESNISASLSEGVNTQSIVTSASVNVASNVSVISSDCAKSVVSPRNKIDSTSHLLPQTSPKQLSSNTVTTYSLLHYHNFYSHSHPQDNKCIYTTAHVPEVETVSSSVIAVAAPSFKDISDSCQKSCGNSKSQADVSELSNKSVKNTLTCDIKESDRNKTVSLMALADSNEKRHLSESARCNSHNYVQNECDLKGRVSDRHCKNKDLTVVKDLEVHSRKHHVCNKLGTEDDVSVINALIISKSNLDNRTRIESEIVQDLSQGKQRIKDNKKISEDVKSACAPTKSCDFNHNNSNKQNQLSCKIYDMQLSSCVDLLEDDDQLVEKHETEIHKETLKKINAIQPITSTKELPESVIKAHKKESHDSPESDIGATAKRKPNTKQSHGQVSNTGIPVGIAVARQRNIAPKMHGVEKDVKKQPEETKNKTHIADVTHIRPLKIIQPSANVVNKVLNDKRNELPANLIVTGGMQQPGMFWPDDTSSQQLALQNLQSTHPDPPAAWYEHSAFQYTPTDVPTTSCGTNATPLPLTASAGFKLAQDSITGQIILLPQGADVCGGLTLENGIGHTSSFGATVLPSALTSMSLSTTETLYSGQKSITSRPPGLDMNTHFQDIFNSNPLSEKNFTEDKCSPAPEENTPIMLTTARTETPTVLNLDSGNKNGPAITASQSDFVPGQTCPYTFPPQPVPTTLSSSLAASHIEDQIPDIIQDKHEYKHEPTSVQSRGTSPMLPASDSCMEDIEEVQLSHDKSEEIFESATENENSAINNNIMEITNLHTEIKELTVDQHERSNLMNVKQELQENQVHVSFTQAEEHILQDVNCSLLIKQNACLDDHKIKNTTLVECNRCHSPKADRNIFNCLRGYDPFQDPNVLEAKEGLELLSALAERSAHALCMDSIDQCSNKSTNNFSVTITCPVSMSENTNIDHTTDTSCVEATDLTMVCEQASHRIRNEDIVINTGGKEYCKGEAMKPRIKCGRLFKPKIKQEKCVSLEKETTTFCGIVIPKDDDIIDSIETEMKMRLAELQKQYKEKQRQLAKLTPKKPKEIETESQDAEKNKESHDLTRGPGRPKKRLIHTSVSTDGVSDKGTKNTKTDNQDISRNMQSQYNAVSNAHGHTEKLQSNVAAIEHTPSKKAQSNVAASGHMPTKKAQSNIVASGHMPTKKAQSDVVASGNMPTKKAQSKVAAHGQIPTKKAQLNIAANGHTPTKKAQANIAANGHGPAKKKNLAEMLVDRVFRKAGNSFKIPLSKKVNLIAPARIEFLGTSTTPNRGENGRWHKKYSSDNKHLSFHADLKLKKQNRESGKNVSPENGLGLLAEYATRTDVEIQKRKRKSNEADVTSLTPDSPNKKRKPGRPKKCDIIQPGVTETIVAKQSKHIDLFQWQTVEPNNEWQTVEPKKEWQTVEPKKEWQTVEPKKEWKTVEPNKEWQTVEPKKEWQTVEPKKEWQTVEPKKERKISSPLEGKTPLQPLYLDEWNVRRSERIFLNDPSPQTSPNAMSPGVKNKPSITIGESNDKKKLEKQKKLQTVQISQKVKKKYSMTYSLQQKSREKTTELLKASRDRLTKKRIDLREKMNSSSPGNNDSDSEDVPLSSLKHRIPMPVLEQCTIEKNELEDGMKILVFMDGLFHEGELKAIRPPDIYCAILENDRKTRPHYYSQEEILKDAIKDTKPACVKQLKEGTRICAYWSQQFSCLYPGTISRGSPNPKADRSLVNVEFDDGDTGRIPIDHIRIIPQEFPHVDFDSNPLLLLTKRRRTLSTSESSDSRKSTSCDISKDQKGKHGPEKPAKAGQQPSIDSVGNDDVFYNKLNDTKCKPKSENKQAHNNDSINVTSAATQPARELWTWSGSSTKRPGLKGKAKREYFKTIVRGNETLSVGECAVFLSTGRPTLPYVGHIESFWEGWSGQMVVKVKWFYHPQETKGGRQLQNMKGALFRSDHEDENDVQTISHKCAVLTYNEYRRRVDVISHEHSDNIYYLAGSYDPSIGHIKFEPGVI